MQNSFQCYMCISVNTVVLLFHKGFVAQRICWIKIKANQRGFLSLDFRKRKRNAAEPCTVNCKSVNSGRKLYVWRCGGVLSCCSIAANSLQTSCGLRCLSTASHSTLAHLHRYLDFYVDIYVDIYIGIYIGILGSGQPHSTINWRLMNF